mgnify:CR=1 FL=1
MSPSVGTDVATGITITPPARLNVNVVAPAVQFSVPVNEPVVALDSVTVVEAEPPAGTGIDSGDAENGAAGAVQGDDGRIRFPRALVEDMLAIAARDITLYARDAKQDLHLTGTNVHYGTAGAAVSRPM